MKKIIIIAFALVVSIAASAQMKTTDYNYSSFKGISADSEFEVAVSFGKDYKVSVQAESPYMQYISVGVSAGNLEITMNEKAVPAEVKKLYKGVKPAFKATVVMPALEKIVLKGKSVMTVQGELKSNGSVDVTVTDNAELKPLAVVAPECKVVLEKKGAADITFNGEKIVVAASGSSNLNLTREVNDSEIALSGASNLVLRGSSNSMVISSKGASKAALNGSATNVEYTLGGTSNINAVGMEASTAKVSMSGLCSLTQAAKDSLSINVTGGASLVFDGAPVIDIETVKNASVTHYNSK